MFRFWCIDGKNIIPGSGEQTIINLQINSNENKPNEFSLQINNLFLSEENGKLQLTEDSKDSSIFSFYFRNEASSIVETESKETNSKIEENKEENKENNEESKFTLLQSKEKAKLQILEEIIQSEKNQKNTIVFCRDIYFTKKINQSFNNKNENSSEILNKEDQINIEKEEQNLIICFNDIDLIKIINQIKEKQIKFKNVIFFDLLNIELYNEIYNELVVPQNNNNYLILSEFYNIDEYKLFFNFLNEKLNEIQCNKNDFEKLLTQKQNKEIFIFGVPLTSDILEKISSLLEYISIWSNKFFYDENLLSKKDLHSLKERIEFGESLSLHENGNDFSIVISILLVFLQNIPGGLFPVDNYNKLMKIVDEFDGLTNPLYSIRSEIVALPRVNYVFVNSLFDCLHSLAAGYNTSCTTFDIAKLFTSSIVNNIHDGDDDESNLHDEKAISLIELIIRAFPNIYSSSPYQSLAKSHKHRPIKELTKSNEKKEPPSSNPIGEVEEEEEEILKNNHNNKNHIQPPNIQISNQQQQQQQHNPNFPSYIPHGSQQVNTQILMPSITAQQPRPSYYNFPGSVANPMVNRTNHQQHQHHHQHQQHQQPPPFSFYQQQQQNTQPPTNQPSIPFNTQSPLFPQQQQQQPPPHAFNPPKYSMPTQYHPNSPTPHQNYNPSMPMVNMGGAQPHPHPHNVQNPNLNPNQPCGPPISPVSPRRREHWELSPNEIRFGNKIGAGSFGEVWKGEWAGIVVAIKKIHVSKIGPKEQQAFRDEITIMRYFFFFFILFIIFCSFCILFQVNFDTQILFNF